MTLGFVAKPEKDARFLREGRVDLEIGVLKNMGPEIRLQALFRDRFVVALAKKPSAGRLGRHVAGTICFRGASLPPVAG